MRHEAVATRWLDNFWAGLMAVLVWTLALLLWPLQLALTFEQERRVAGFRERVAWVEKFIADSN